jgi:CBS domain-containing protein
MLVFTRRRPTNKPLVVLEKGHTVHDAMELLAEHDILGAPVVESKSHTGNFIGKLTF